jgi:hypothetical protein
MGTAFAQHAQGHGFNPQHFNKMNKKYHKAILLNKLTHEL